MQTLRKQFERNLGFLSDKEQERLCSSSVAIAGAGGDGGMLALQLARVGIGKLKLADPDTFEEQNLNRQAVCSTKTLGKNKAEAVAEYILDINPEIKIEVYNEGITRDNAADFVSGSDLLIDETEFTLSPDIGISLAREARKRKIPNMTAFNLGFAAMVTTFDPEGYTLEANLGLSEDLSLEEIAKAEVPLSRWLSYIPPYGDMDVLKKVASGAKSAPSIAPGVSMAAAIGTTQAMLNLLEGNNRPSATMAPHALVVDAYTMRAKKVRVGKASYYRHLLPMVARNLLRLNPKASY